MELLPRLAADLEFRVALARFEVLRDEAVPGVRLDRGALPRLDGLGDRDLLARVRVDPVDARGRVVRQRLGRLSRARTAEERVRRARASEASDS